MKRTIDKIIMDMEYERIKRAVELSARRDYLKNGMIATGMNEMQVEACLHLPGLFPELHDKTRDN
jgi:hypothetical protein